MFEKRFHEAYQNIKAPEKLKDRVMSLKNPDECEKVKKIPRVISMGITAVLCSVVIVFVAFLMGRNDGGLQIFYNGEKIGETAVILSQSDVNSAPFGLRSVEFNGVSFELRVSGYTKLSVTEGTLSAFDSDTLELMDDGKELILNKNAELYWDITGIYSGEYILSLEGDNQHDFYSLSVCDGKAYEIKKII